MERSSKSPDYLLRFWLLALCITIGLGGLYFLPEQILGWDVNKVDLLGDLRRGQTDSLAISTDDPRALSQQARSQTAEVRKREAIYEQLKQEQVKSGSSTSSTEEDSDTARHTPKNIELSEANTLSDMTAGHDGLQHFFSQLRQRNGLHRPIRIAVLGDSFIEGDIFTGALRSALQARYGGSGIGWMPITSETAGFRQTIRHEFKGWKDHNQFHSKGKYPLPGHYYTGSEGDWARYTLPKGSTPCAEATIYYRSTSTTTLSVTVNGGESSLVELPPSDGLTAHQLASGSISSLRFSLASGASGFICYGVSLDGASGVSLDNFSLRGNSGLLLGSLDTELTRSFAHARPYDLIILQYGLNAIGPKQLDYSGYGKQFGRSLHHLRSLLGRVDYLLLGVSDRGTKSDGQVITMPAVRAMEQAQLRLAADQGIVFWSTRAAVGRLGGIGKLAERGWAAKDYTHLSHRGGKELAKQFLDAFLLEEKYYDAIK